MSYLFFDAAREHFFRPLTGVRRELVARCVQSLYARLHGPGADHTLDLDREGVRLLLESVIKHNPSLVRPDSADDAVFEGADPWASKILRVLLDSGWLEFHEDIAGRAIYRFTRTGKRFAEVFFELSKSKGSIRQRNMRSCRNALSAYLEGKDPLDLLDAHEYAERVISDLGESIEQVNDMLRDLVKDVSTRSAWGQLNALIEKFNKELSFQFTTDSAERHKGAIRKLTTAMDSWGVDEKARQDEKIRSLAPWVEQEAAGSCFDWLLERINSIIYAACTTKLPELHEVVHTAVRRHTTVLNQAMSLASQKGQRSVLDSIQRLCELGPADQQQCLSILADNLAPARVRLVDPAQFRLRATVTREAIQSTQVIAEVSAQARLKAAIAHAQASAFSLSVAELGQELLALVSDRGSVKLSELPIRNAMDALKALQAVEAARSISKSPLRVQRLGQLCDNPYFTCDDYLFTRSAA